MIYLILCLYIQQGMTKERKDDLRNYHENIQRDGRNGSHSLTYSHPLSQSVAIVKQKLHILYSLDATE